MAHKKILIVDDDSEFLLELRELLASSGYDIVSVSDGMAVIDEALKEKPDLILVDLKMPQKSGFQVASEINSFPDLKNIPIIAMSGYFKDEYSLFFTICGIKKYLKKPFYPLDVISRIEDVLAQSDKEKENMNGEYKRRISQNDESGFRVRTRSKDSISGSRGSNPRTGGGEDYRKNKRDRL